MSRKKSVSMRAMRGTPWLVWGMFLALLVGGGCESNSSSASTSSSSGVDPLGVEASVSQTTVLDGTAFLSPQVSFEVRNAQGGVGFAVRSEPAVDWFVVANDVLSFAGLLRADYDAEVLAGVEDGGDGKPIKLTIVATDAGRSGNNEATVDVTVLVALPDFAASVSPSTVYVRDGRSPADEEAPFDEEEGRVFSDFVVFSSSGARGAVSYELMGASPAVDWFVLDADGLLRFADGQKACYDNDSRTPESPCPLHGLETDEGEGKPVVLTVRATDAGKGEGDERRAMVELTVNVLPPPFELSASPSVVTIDSGSNRLNASNRIDITLDNPQYLLGEASYSVSTDLEGEWFTIHPSEDDTRNGVLSLARALDYTALGSVPQTEAGRLLQVRVRLEDGGRTMTASAEQLVDVVVTLRPQVSPLWLDPSTLLSEVEQSSSVMTPEIRFTPNALGTMSYTVATQPSSVSGWFALREEGEYGAVVLEFAAGQTADYDVLTGLADAGVRSVTVTVTGVDDMRSSNSSASASITLAVHQLAVGLEVSAETSVFSGSTTLAPAPTIGSSNAFGRVRYAIAEVRPAVDWFAIDAALGTFSLIRPANYHDSALDSLSDDGSGRAIEVDIELTALDRTAGQRATKTLVVRVRQAGSFSIFSDNGRARVDHDSTALSAPIQFSTQGPTSGDVTYTRATTPEADWIAVGEADGVLSLSAAADYITLAGTSLNEIKEVVVTVTATDEAASAASTSVIIEVARPAGAFHLLADASEASVRNGESTLSPAIKLSTENAAGTVSYAIVEAVPGLNWFVVGSDGVLGFASGQMADYGTDSGDALELVADFGAGKPVLVTLSATDADSGAIAQTTVQVFVLPPSLTVSVSPPVASIAHGTRAIDTALTVGVTQAVGVLSYEVLTDPVTDWFGVKPSSGAIYVRADRAVDWSDLAVDEASDRNKALSVRVRVTDSGRVGEDAAESSTVTLNVTPADFTIYASRASAPVENGASDQSTTIRFYSEANIGAVTYSVLGTSPSVDWFAVVDDGNGGGDLHIAKEKTAYYTNAALAGAVDSGHGKPIYVSARGTDTGGFMADTSVIVYVRPPEFNLQVSPTETELQEQGASLETEIVFTPTGAAGSVNYQLATSPSVDWFEVENNKLALVFAAEVRSETIGTNTIQISVRARDSGRPSLDPGSLIDVSEIITVNLIPAYGIRIELNATRAEFFEKGGQPNPTINYEIKEHPETPSLWLLGNTVLCNAEECKTGIEVTHWHEPGSLRITMDDANFWQTKQNYHQRGDDQSLPLYLWMYAVFPSRGQFGEPPRDYLFIAPGQHRELILTMKNIPNDERITRFEGEELTMPEGDGDDLFFFPISSKLAIESTMPFLGEFEIDDPRFRLRDTNFIYRGSGGQIDAGDYGVHAEPHVGRQAYSAFRPCRSPSYECVLSWFQPEASRVGSVVVSSTIPIPNGEATITDPNKTTPAIPPVIRFADQRFALQPGESLAFGEEPVTVTMTATLLDGEPGYETATATFTIRFVERQDGTEEYPFIVDNADELRSIATHFRNDYTEKYCDILPTCVDGSLARFQTRVSHYLQTADIDLDSNLEDSIGVLGDSAIFFHGGYDGGGFQIHGLDTASGGGLFDNGGGGMLSSKMYICVKSM